MELDLDRAKETAKQLRAETVEDVNGIWTGAKIEALGMFPPLVDCLIKTRKFILRKMTMEIADSNGLSPRTIASDPASRSILNECEKEAIKRMKREGIW